MSRGRNHIVIQRESADSDDSSRAPLLKWSMDALRSSASLLLMGAKEYHSPCLYLQDGVWNPQWILSSLSCGLCVHLSRVESVTMCERFCPRIRGMTTYMIDCRFDDTVFLGFYLLIHSSGFDWLSLASKIMGLFSFLRIKEL